MQAFTRQRLNGQRGFTLIEMILSVAAISVLAYFTVPMMQSFQIRDDLDVAAGIAVQSFRRAETLALASEGDSTWGVAIATGTVTIFKGSSYASRDANYDEVFTTSAAIGPSGLTQVTFVRGSGSPSASGTTTLTSTTGETRDIVLNTQGMVSF